MAHLWKIRARDCNGDRDAPLPCACEPCERRRVRTRAQTRERKRRYVERCEATEAGAALFREKEREGKRLDRKRRSARVAAVFAALRAKALAERRSDHSKRSYQTARANGHPAPHLSSPVIPKP